MKIVMMLNYSFHKNIDSNEALIPFDSVSSREKTPGLRGNLRNLRIISEKIRIPPTALGFKRSRLHELLGRQIEQFGASLILGRAGTGKTTVAVDFAKDYERTAWFRVESTDSHWEAFSQYFISGFQIALPDFGLDFKGFSQNQPVENKVLNFLEQLFFNLEKSTREKRLLIVLDDLHSVFDTQWFETFFNGLLSYENPQIHILMLSRSKPPFPLWRLRSKQKLGVLDENLLLFTSGELEEFLKNSGLSKDEIKWIFQNSFGRISKILELKAFQTLR